MPDPHLELVWSRAQGEPKGPFRALLDAAEEDPEAAEGFALAYASMGRTDRERLVRAIVEDAAASGSSPAGPLALLLGVEEDETLAGEIAGGLDDSIARRGVDGGWRWGDGSEGGVVLVRHLHGRFVEVLSVRWRGSAIEADGVPLACHDEPRIRQRHAVPEGAAVLSLQHAVDELASALWRLRQQGSELPERLRAFAHVFSARGLIDVPAVDGVD